MRLFIAFIVLLLSIRAVHAQQGPQGTLYSTAKTWLETCRTENWLVENRKHLLPVSDPQNMVGMDKSRVLGLLGNPQMACVSGSRTIFTYGLSRWLFFQVVFDSTGIATAAHTNQYRRLMNGVSLGEIKPAAGPMTNDPMYDVAILKTVKERVSPDADVREIALNASRAIVPGMSTHDLEECFNKPQAVVERSLADIHIYRIGDSDFLHVSVGTNDTVIGVAYRQYTRQSGRLSSQVVTGYVERAESPDLVFGDWRAAMYRHVHGFDRVGIGKHVELLVKDRSKDELITLLGKPYQKNDGIWEYDLSFPSSMSLFFNPDGNVMRIQHYGP